MLIRWGFRKFELCNDRLQIKKQKKQASHHLWIKQPTFFLHRGPNIWYCLLVRVALYGFQQSRRQSSIKYPWYAELVIKSNAMQKNVLNPLQTRKLRNIKTREEIQIHRWIWTELSVMPKCWEEKFVLKWLKWITCKTFFCTIYNPDFDSVARSYLLKCCRQPTLHKTQGTTSKITLFKKRLNLEWVHSSLSNNSFGLQEAEVNK